MMKYLPLLILVMVLGLSACKKDEVKSDLDVSYQAWAKFKNQSHSSYTYTAWRFSILDNATRETKFTVFNGQVTGREYVHIRNNFTPPNTISADTVIHWTENATTLNTHPEYYSAWQPATLDEMYALARTWLKADRTKNDVSFTADSAGIISSAGYNVKNCLDDCFNGVHIKDIKIYVKPLK